MCADMLYGIADSEPDNVDTGSQPEAVPEPSVSPFYEQTEMQPMRSALILVHNLAKFASLHSHIFLNCAIFPGCKGIKAQHCIAIYILFHPCLCKRDKISCH